MQSRFDLTQLFSSIATVFTTMSLVLAWSGGTWAAPVVATFRAVTTDNGPSGVNAHHFGIADGTPILGTVIFDPELVQQSVTQPGSFPGLTDSIFVYFDSQGRLHSGGTVTFNIAGQTFEWPIISLTLANWATGTDGSDLGTIPYDQLSIVFGTQSFLDGTGVCGVFNGEVMRACSGNLLLWYTNDTLNNELPASLVIPLAPVPFVSENTFNPHLSFLTLNWNGITQSGAVQAWLDGQDEDTGGVPPKFGGVDADNPIIPDDCAGTPCPPPWRLPPIVVPRMPEFPSDCLTNSGGRIVEVRCPPLGGWIPVDPPVAVGYDYQVTEGSPKIAALELPVLGDNMYRLHLFDGSDDLTIQGGQWYIFPAGVDHFQILDIEASLGLDSEDPRAFVTNLTFVTAGVAQLTMTPITTQSTVMTVSIDIYPGTSPNLFNPKSTGLTPVAILTTASFNASTVDPSSVRFGATGTEATASKSSLQDANGDGRLDLVLQFDTRKTGIKCGMTSGKLTGQTKNSQSIVGSDSIQTVGCK